LTRISQERFSELLAHIYDCVLQPETWSIALREICRELDLLHGVLGYYETPSGNPLLRVRYGLGCEWSDSMPEYQGEMAAYWGGVEQIRAYPICEVVAHSIARPHIDISRNRYATEWCAPQGIADMIGITVAQDTFGLGCLMLASNHRMANSHEADLDLLRLLVPHVRRAVTISKILDLKSIEVASLESALAALPNGIVLLDAETRVIHANVAAEAMLKAQDLIRLVNSRLKLRDEAATRALAEAVSASVDGRSGQRGMGVPAQSRTGAGAILHVLPLKHGIIRGSLDPRAVVAVFITSTDAPPRLPADALGLLYDLTPAEIRICELIAEGRTLAETARHIGVAASTAKSHLLRIFVKTGTNRQSELVRLCSSLSIS
jgi:DNA-binding CsgD family transcriptional regulator/PAS domain-containing protein